MKLLITGGAGYIGTHIALMAKDNGIDVTVVDDFSTGFERCLNQHDINFVSMDIRSPDLIPLMQRAGADAVVHLAAKTSVPESVLLPASYYDINTVGSLNVAKAAVSSGVKHLLFSSTAAVYGNAPHRAFVESDPTNAISPYGWSKLFAEQMIADVCKGTKTQAVILRYFNVAGADPKLRCGQSTKAATHLIKVLSEAAVGTREQVEIFGTDYDTPDGTAIRDFIHVWDLAEIHLKMLSLPPALGATEVFNCGYGKGYSVKEVVEAAQRLGPKPFKVVHSDRRAGDSVVSLANCEKLKRVMGWSPNYQDIDEIVHSAIAWEQTLTNSMVKQ